ncbi:MAG: DMT family transporter [Thermodesulfobacteriota bacterium]
MTRQARATAYALATVLLWSTVASAFKLSLRHLDPPQLLLYASAASALALAGILAVQGRLGVLLTYTRAQYLRSLLLGLLNPFLYYLVLFQAYDRLPAQEAQALNYTWAITLALLSVPLLGQRMRRADVAGGLVSYAGVVVIATRGDLLGLRFSDPFGVALALGSTVLWSLYWIANTSLVFLRTHVGEAILPSTLAGLALIVAGLAVQQVFTSRPSAPRSGPPSA